MKDRMCQAFANPCGFAWAIRRIVAVSTGMAHSNFSTFRHRFDPFYPDFFVELTIFIPDFAPGGDTKRG